MNGLPSNNPEEQARVDASAEIHARSRQLIRAVMQTAGQGGFEQPPSAMSWYQRDNIDLLRRWQRTAPLSPPVLMAGIFSSHGPFVHRSRKSAALHAPANIRLARTKASPERNRTGFTSPSSRQNTLLLWRSSWQHAWQNTPRVWDTKMCCAIFARGIRAPQTKTLRWGRLEQHSRFHSPRTLDSLCAAIQQWMSQGDRTRSVMSSLAQGRPTRPLSEEQQAELLQLTHRVLHPDCQRRLNILQTLARLAKDADSGLPHILKQGVPTEIFEAIPSSMQWAQKHCSTTEDSKDDIELLHSQGKWTRAEQDPSLLRTLLQKEIDNGWVQKFTGAKADAEQRWPNRTAIGKLNTVLADGKEPRLVLDSTICNANPMCKIPEHVSLPSALDVQRSFLRADCYGDLRCTALDFKAAHKCVKVAPHEQGTLLFEVEGQLYHYTVCHFGARFSAYWWARVGGLLTRILRRMLQRFGHCAWLYVDDLLLLFRSADHCAGTCMAIALLSIVNAPVSWKKAQVGEPATWCGWTFSFAFETVHLREPKLRKLREQFARIAQAKKTSRKQLEAALGLLMWATSTCPHLRPYMAPLYRDLHGGSGTLKQIHAPQWQSFLDSLSEKAIVIAQPAGLWLPLHAKVTKLGSSEVTCKANLPRVPPSHKSQWICIFDPHRSEIHLRTEARQALLWLATCFSHDRVRSMRQSPMLHCYAAADARADGDIVGIGGWFVSASQCTWFAEQWNISEMRSLASNAQARSALHRML